ncbi:MULTISPECIES: hypothetical protein [unclassified Leuconostoc]|uniref:hypothetical protein n=1 Tax=unclassified Leuconostoc TaxID=2685106 RepID=UPI001903BDAA|nr:MULTISPECIES: hypothetical protein [unclassified Leuconostoc]MBK0040761.1 hypothetical protein [Leuconostoc sp. S51]MBK0051817.1 hypothetical protein [Leuconostoc sp. S50]
MSKLPLKVKTGLILALIISTYSLFYLFLIKYPEQFDKYITVIFFYPIGIITIYSVVYTILNSNALIQSISIVVSSLLNSFVSSFLSMMTMIIWVTFQAPNASKDNLSHIHILYGNFVPDFKNSMGDLINQLQIAGSHGLSYLSLGLIVVPQVLICLPIFSNSSKKIIVWECLITLVLGIALFIAHYFAS